jgi:hypothetical protein
MKEIGNKRSGIRLPVRWFEKPGPLIMVDGKSSGYLVRLLFPNRFGSTRRLWVYDPGAESAEREVNR